MPSSKSASFAPLAAPILALFLLLPSRGADAQAPAATRDADARLARQLDSVFAPLARDSLFSGVVLVARNGVPVFRRGYGFANAEHGIPNAPDGAFRIASLTKSFTAAAVLRLADRGALRLDDPLRKHLPQLPPAYDAVTVHHALTHTGGIPSHTTRREFLARRSVGLSVDSLVALIAQDSLRFAPGTRYAYSNAGYALLGAMVQRVAGVPYEEFLRREVLEPAGLTRTFVERADRLVPKRISGHHLDSVALRPAPMLDPSTYFAAGDLVSTTDDLLRWTRAVREGPLLSDSARRRMFTPISGGMAYGWEIVPDLEGHPAFLFNGAIDGFLTNVTQFTDRDLTVVIASNVVVTSGGVTRPRLQSIRRSIYLVLQGH